MAHETFELLARLRGRQAAMATLVRTSGATPRKEGAKMFVDANGDIFGSVTIGGCVDARVIEQAPAVLASGTPQLHRLDLGNEDAWEIGLTCGGAVDVFIEPVTEELLSIYESARAEWDAGRAVAIATTLSTGARRIVDPSSSTDDVYVEILRPPATLLVFGASEVAITLIAFAKKLGFRTVVVDARPRFANRERFPEADELRVGIASEIAQQIGIGATTAVVLVAHDYKIDIPVLREVLATDAPYIGLLGSRRRGAAVLQMLREAGVADEQLTRVRVPIGLDLGGKTAAEIALSIAAQVVAVLHGRPS
jgi:xanthine dehydrogenase accessory factor